MTLTKMSSEGDSAKNVSLDAKEKVVNDLTDSSQDSADLKAEKDAKEAKPTQNDVEKKEEKPEATTEEESMDSEEASVTSEKKEETEGKCEDKPDSKDVKEEEKTKENGTNEAKKEEKDEKTEKKEKEEVKNNTKEEKDKEKADGDKTGKEQNGDEEAGEEEEDEEEDGEEEEEEEDEEEVEKKKKPAAARGRKRKADAEPAAKKDKKTPAKDKEEDKEEEEDEGEEDEDEEESEEEPEPTQVIFLDGGGLPLSEIARVEASVTRFKTDDLKNLHTLLFRMVGKMSMLKKNIKRFNGFTFKKNSEKYKKKVAFLNELELKDVKTICEQLDLQKMGSKEDLITRIMDFLMDPKEPGKNASTGGGEKGASGRPKRASAVRANNRGYSSHDDYSSDEKQRGPRSRGKRPNLKEDSTSDEEFKPGGEDYDSEEKPKVVNRGGPGRKRGRPKKDSSEEEASLTESEEDSDFDAEPKSKARKRTPAKVNNKSKKTPSRGRGRPARGGAAGKKKTPGRGRKAKDVSSESEEDDAEASSSEDEPLSKRSKGKKAGPPTDEDIKTFIKELLEGANLEEITMKTVCQKVYDNYPDFDLTNKKYFIKSTVKSLIST